MSATACHAADPAPITFAITHPFHPQRGTRWVLVTRKQNWGEDRVLYYDRGGRLRSMRTSWTSLVDPDLFSQAAQGRSWFRVDDLLQLAALLRDLRSTPQKEVAYVK
jgi:hypothetical protein